MTETVSNKVLKKLEVMQEDMTDIKVKVAQISTKIENQPLLDDAKHSTLEEKIANHDKKINNLESNQKWVVIAILGIIINAVMQLILHQG